ncbi:MAG: aminopeptidase P family protein [Actinobacteria bacterium]|nr:aminopeptidase P family protein [Actinomycetota bacterium]
MADRIGRLRQRLAEQGIDGAVIRRPPNIYYLTAYSPGVSRPGFVVVSPERAVLVAPGSADGLRAAVRGRVEVIAYRVPGATVDAVADVDELSGEALGTALEQAGLGGRRVGIEEAAISVRHFDVVRQRVGATGPHGGFGPAGRGSTVSLAGEVEALRRVKDTEELALFRAAVGCNDVGFEAARRTIVPGVTEFQIERAIVAAMEAAAGVPIDILDDTNGIISGPRTAGVVGLATGRRLERGDLVIVDLNPFINSYKGDTTRTFSVGEPSAEHRRLYDVVRRSLERMETRVRPGTRGRDVYAVFAETVAEAGYSDGMIGHGGHAIGLEHLERPYIIAGEDMPLEEGMTITLEPGLYLPGVGGMRLEDNYVVTSSGVELLSHYSRELIRCD